LKDWHICSSEVCIFAVNATELFWYMSLYIYYVLGGIT
jgi:hypothetical protein